MSSSDSITVVEVGPRDGLQYERNFFPTQKKAELINLLSEAGVKKIEVTSFVHPKAVPQLKDAEQLLGKLEKREDVTYCALVPNQKGCQRALRTSIDEIALFVSASETHNQKNVGMSISESINQLQKVSKMTIKEGRSLRGYVVTAFGCPYEGRISVKDVRKVIKAYIDMGVCEVSLGDTTGMANPLQVRKMIKQLGDLKEKISLAVHFHNPRGTGLVNAFAAYEAGISVFDSSVGGVGGCRAAVDAGFLGNIATEDFVNMMEEMGVRTGVDFSCLVDAAKFLKETLQVELPSFTLRAGRPKWREEN